ncbi:MAG TPA: hypothetical protein VIK47_03355 [Kiloniellales bacterium]
MKGCRNCRSWQSREEFLDRIDAATSGQKVQMGVCRRYAPHPALGGSAGNSPAEAQWPSVPSDAWCGEWEPNIQ